MFDKPTGNRLAVSFNFIYPEVIEMLQNDGFDIIRRFGIKDEIVEYAVSVKDAEEGRRGIIIDQNPVSMVDDFLSSLFSEEGEETEESDEAGESEE